MPIDYSRYPANWNQISLQIREREGQKCKWCGAPNGQLIWRNALNPVEWSPAPEGHLADAMALDGQRFVKVVLTVAHLGVPKPDGQPGDKHDKHDVRPENLAALCQRCHLVFDLTEHIENRKRTIRLKKASGDLFEEK